MLKLDASFVNAIQKPPLHPDFSGACEIAVLRPTRHRLPPCLQPTHLQMNSPHPGWMDVLPFPELRDNLIRRQHSFDHIQFLRDLLGDLVERAPSRVQRQRGLILQGNSRDCDNEYDDKTALNGEGLILWGEPYLKESWEATPQFLVKWAWATMGCYELVNISNRWRISRGEEPLECCAVIDGIGRD